jgi:potassium-transporting ATPase KdpC subunit
MRRQLWPSLLMMVVFILVFGLAYPLVVTGIAQVAFHDDANGSLIEDDGEPVGSRLVGQAFTDADGNPLPQYFQSRPSAAGYDPTLSLGSNLGPTNPDLLAAVEERAAAYRELNGLDPDTSVPVDAVTASASGLDPDISVANARLQAPRVARERGLEVSAVLDLVEDHTETRTLGFLGEDRVNVVALNLAVDALT